MITCNLCKKSFPTKLKIEGKMRNFQNRKYCFNCSPFRNRNTKKLEFHMLYVSDGKKYCVGCKTEKFLNEFYKQGKGVRKYCKICSGLNTSNHIRQTECKQKCIDYKGGKCQICGYNKCNGALEFHHRNPSEKEFAISKFKTKRFCEETKKELDKCDLLCANCHREQHEKVNKLNMTD